MQPHEISQERIDLLESLGEHEGWKILFERLSKAISVEASVCARFNPDHAKWAHASGHLQGLIDAAEMRRRMLEELKAKVKEKAE